MQAPPPPPPHSASESLRSFLADEDTEVGRRSVDIADLSDLQLRILEIHGEPHYPPSVIPQRFSTANVAASDTPGKPIETLPSLCLSRSNFFPFFRRVGAGSTVGTRRRYFTHQYEHPSYRRDTTHNQEPIDTRSIHATLNTHRPLISTIAYNNGTRQSNSTT